MACRCHTLGKVASATVQCSTCCRDYVPPNDNYMIQGNAMVSVSTSSIDCIWLATQTQCYSIVCVTVRYGTKTAVISVAAFDLVSAGCNEASQSRLPSKPLRKPSSRPSVIECHCWADSMHHLAALFIASGKSIEVNIICCQTPSLWWIMQHRVITKYLHKTITIKLSQQPIHHCGPSLIYVHLV